MIPKKEIIFAMSLNEIPFSTLYNEALKYCETSKYEISEIIDKGCNSPEMTKIVAYILGMKSYIPTGFKPKTREEIIQNKIKNMAILDSLQPNITGYTQNVYHKSCISLNERIIKNIKNRSFISKIIDYLGGGQELSDRMGYNIHTIYKWRREKSGHVYIPPRYINSLLNILEEEGMIVTLNDFTSMMPEDKQDLYFRANKRLK
jgi:hypothetical protein